MQKRGTWIVIGLAAAVIAAGAVFLGYSYVARVTAQDAAETASSPEIGGPFTLVDHTGRTVTDRDFRGKLMLVYFGYTFCPDVCPTDLQIIGDAMDILGKAGNDVQPIFVTIDPERDTVAVMADYVGNFHPRLLGLTGTEEQIAAAAKAYRVAYFKVFYPPFEDDDENAAGDTNDENGDDNADYLMNHSAFTYLMGRDGRYLGVFPNGARPEDMAAEIRAQLNGPSS
ncbi:MAG: SCO family protein [Alphaproteobacteria bacterium]